MAECDVKYDGPNAFVHLHCHTVYSTLDGVQTPEQLVGTTADRGWPAVAVTEHGHMASVPDNYFAAKERGIKYIPACEIYFNDYEPLRRQMVERGESIPELKKTNPDLHSRIMRNRHVTVLAKNMAGFHNLIHLTTEAWEKGYYYRPRIWFDQLAERHEGLIVLSGCLNGPISHELRNKNLKNRDGRGAIDYLHKFLDVFGSDFYIEMQMPCLPDYKDYIIFWALNKLAIQYKLPKVMTNDAHYIDRRDFETQKLMMAVDQGVTVDSPDLFHVNSSEQYLKTRAELYQTFKSREYSKNVTDADFEEACNNTLAVAEKCDFFKPDTQPKIPTSDADVQELKRMVGTELIRRGLHKCTRKYVVDNREVTYTDQAKIELNRFIEKGFASYFLITRSLIQYSLSIGAPVGPRGSVGGSLVCYLLGITELDPLKWGLSFDRFLSPARGGYNLNIKAK